MASAALGRDYRRLRRASALSALGDGLISAALPLLAADLTRDALAVAGVLAVQRLPWVLLVLAGPAVLARRDLRTPMGGLSTLRALVVAAVGLAHLLARVDLWALYVAAGVVGLAQAVLDDVTDETVAAVVPSAQAGRAAGGVAVIELVANGVGLPLGAWLFSLLPALPFLVDTVSFSLAALLVLLLRLPARRSGGRAPPLRAAVGRLRATPSLAALALVVAAVGLAGGAAGGPLVLYALERLGGQPLAFGLLLAAGAGGALVGVAAAPEAGRLLRAGPALVLGLLVTGVGYAVVPGLGAVDTAAAALALAGLGGMTTTVVATAVRLAAAPAAGAPLTRLFRLVTWAAIPAGAVTGGALASVHGLAAAFWAAAGSCGAGALAAWPAGGRRRPAAPLAPPRQRAPHPRATGAAAAAKGGG